MTATDFGFMPLDKHDLGLPRNLGDAFAELLKARWPFNTAKLAATAFDYDPTTAANAVKGKGGARSVTKAVHLQQKAAQDAWELWMALGKEVIGESFEAYTERRLQRLIEENNRARERIETIRARRKRLETTAHEVAGLVNRPMDGDDSGKPSSPWAPSDGVGDQGLAKPAKRESR